MELKCDDCGIVNEEVLEMNCPWEEEVNDIEEKCQLCPKCAEERYLDT